MIPFFSRYDIFIIIIYPRHSILLSVVFIYQQRFIHCYLNYIINITVPPLNYDCFVSYLEYFYHLHSLTYNKFLIYFISFHMLFEFLNTQFVSTLICMFIFCLVIENNINTAIRRVDLHKFNIFLNFCFYVKGNLIFLKLSRKCYG